MAEEVLGKECENHKEVSRIHEISWEFDGYARCNNCHQIIKVNDVPYKVSTQNLQRICRKQS